MTAPTPEAFLASPSTDEDDFEEAPALDVGSLTASPEFYASLQGVPAEAINVQGVLVDTGNPLESIAASLRQMVDVFTGGGGPTQLIEELNEIEAMHDAKQQLIEDVLAICKPSTSKLANSIRAVLEPVVAPPTPEPLGPLPTYEHPEHDADFSTMNRSQIRTLLGIPQPTED